TPGGLRQGLVVLGLPARGESGRGLLGLGHLPHVPADGTAGHGEHEHSRCGAYEQAFAGLAAGLLVGVRGRAVVGVVAVIPVVAVVAVVVVIPVVAVLPVAAATAGAAAVQVLVS